MPTIFINKSDKMKGAKSAKIINNDYWLMEFHWDIFNDLIELQGYWGENVFCKMCKKLAKYNYKDFHGTLRCSKCRKTFSPMVSTIFNNSKLYLPVWLYAIHILKVTDPHITLRKLVTILDITNVTACNMRKKIKTITEESIEFRLYKKHKNDIIDTFTSLDV